MIRIKNSLLEKIDKDSISTEIHRFAETNSFEFNNVILTAKDHLTRLSNGFTIYSDYHNQWDPIFAGLIELIITLNNQKWSHDLAMEITKYISDLSFDYSILNQVEQ